MHGHAAGRNAAHYAIDVPNLLLTAMLLDIAARRDCVNVMCSQKDNKGNTLALKLVKEVVKTGKYWNEGQFSMYNTMPATACNIVQDLIKILHETCHEMAFNLCNNAGISPASLLIKVMTSAEACRLKPFIKCALAKGQYCYAAECSLLFQYAACLCSFP